VYWDLAAGLGLLVGGRFALRWVLKKRFPILHLGLSLIVVAVSLWLLIPMVAAIIQGA
jgi:hypothetical protein